MNEEMEYFENNQTWELVKPPKEENIVGYKWVYKRKESILGVEDIRFKAF